ncbi:MAG: YggS family pyridoxal phosphate-dependent enzyme [Synergistaceae bacterium]|nr:YggS family pyridoxal phosphate-dependent enzyme [Synergistaceae bacterium]
MVTIKDRIEAIRERMAESASRAGRDPSGIKLVAVTKTRTPEEMLEAAPFVDGLGENRIQEAASKKQIWPASVKAEWRMIGHIQSNKARKAIALFDSLDSIDSEDIARTVERIAVEEHRIVPVLLEVNTSGETSKTGSAPEDFPALLDCVLECGHLRLDGLMTIGPLLAQQAPVRRAFAMLRTLAEDARLRSGLPLPVLSMGMSDDFELAVAEGSSMVRIGTSLFESGT